MSNKSVVFVVLAEDKDVARRRAARRATTRWTGSSSSTAPLPLRGSNAGAPPGALFSCPRGARSADQLAQPRARRAPLRARTRAPTRRRRASALRAGTLARFDRACCRAWALSGAWAAVSTLIAAHAPEHARRVRGREARRARAAEARCARARRARAVPRARWPARGARERGTAAARSGASGAGGRARARRGREAARERSERRARGAARRRRERKRAASRARRGSGRRRPPRRKRARLSAEPVVARRARGPPVLRVASLEHRPDVGPGGVLLDALDQLFLVGRRAAPRARGCWRRAACSSPGGPDRASPTSRRP